MMRKPIGRKSHMNKYKNLRAVLEWIIETDDKNRHKVNYDLDKTLNIAERKIRNLKLKNL